MSIDSRDKRFSMMGMTQSVRPLMPLPDGGFSTKLDRYQLLGLYRSAAVAVTLATSSVWSKVVNVWRVDEQVVVAD